MHARWLLCLETIALAILVYFAEMSANLRFQGTPSGLDEAYDIESHMHYFIWRLRAREVLLLVIVLWVAAAFLVAYRVTRANDEESDTAKYGSSYTIWATLILPLVVLTAGFFFGLGEGV